MYKQSGEGQGMWDGGYESCQGPCDGCTVSTNHLPTYLLLSSQEITIMRPIYFQWVI